MIRTILSVSLAWMLLALPGSASGQERFVTPVSYGTSRAVFTQPVIATDGQTFLTAWIEMGGPGPRVVVQRLDQASPTTVPKTIYADFGVAHGSVNLAWTGSDYLMIHTAGAHLRSVRLDRAGDAITGTSRVLERGIRGGALTSRGSESLIVGRIGSETVALVLDANDHIVRQEIVATDPFKIADVAATATGFVLILSSNTELASVRLDPQGNRLDPGPIRILTSDGTLLQVRLLEADGRILVVWTAFRSRGVSDLFSAIIGPTGEASPAVVLPHQVSSIGSIDVVREASGYQLLLTGGTLNSTGSIVDSDLETLRLDDNGHALSAPRRFGPTLLLETGAKLARNQHGYGAIWRTDLNQQLTESRIAGFTGPALELDPPSLPLSRTVTSQIKADVAGDGLGYLVAWLEEDLDRQKIVAARLDAQGNAVGDPLVLFERHFSFTSPPKVVYAHGMYLVTWNVERSLWGMRVDAEGRRLDPQPVLISGTSRALQDFDVTSSPVGFFAVWKPERSDIIGAELTLAGATTPQPVTVSIEIPAGYISDQSAPQVAFNGEIYLVAYTHSESLPASNATSQKKI